MITTTKPIKVSTAASSRIMRPVFRFSIHSTVITPVCTSTTRPANATSTVANWMTKRTMKTKSPKER